MSVNEFITVFELPLHQLKQFANSSPENRQLILKYAQYASAKTCRQISHAITA